MGMRGALRTVAVLAAGAVATMAPAAGAFADSSAVPTKVSAPAPAAATRPVPTSNAGLSPQVAQAAADAPNSIAAVKTTSPANGWIGEAIQTSTDNDFYRFFNSKTQFVRVLLGDQVFTNGDLIQTNDYAVILYNSKGTEITRSARAGGVAEEVYRQLGPGYYFVRVLRQLGGAYQNPAHSYVVRFQQYAEGMAIIGDNFYQASNTSWYHAGEVLNNTSQWRTVRVTTTVYDASNHVVKSGSVGTFAMIVGPRGRTPFVLSFGALPDTIDHYVVQVVGTPSSTTGITGLSLTSGKLTASGSLFAISGSIANNSTVNRTQVRTAGLLFGARGQLLYVGYEATSYALPVHAKHNYTVKINAADGAVAQRVDYTGR